MGLAAVSAPSFSACGTKRTNPIAAVMSVNDPNRTFQPAVCSVRVSGWHKADCEVRSLTLPHLTQSRHHA
jgi:hypothetical protein